jgi:hypothetical protein
MTVDKYGDFQVVPGYFNPHVVGKLANMRKPQEFSVNPASDGTIYVQSSKSTGRFDFRTRKGVLNTKGTSFAHLTKMLGAVEFDFPVDFVAACLAACPAQDSETSKGGVTLVNTVKVI